MIKLLLKRIAKKNSYTIGKLYINSLYFCDTLEDKDRGLSQSMKLELISKLKIKDLTAIPTGTYKVSMDVISPRFKNTSWAKVYGGKPPRIQGVPGFDGVLIHPGNTSSDTSGCILVGLNKVVGKVINSLATWKKLMDKLLTDKSNIYLTIE